MMATSDYEVIADAIAETADATETSAMVALAERMARALKRDNPRFHRPTFMRRALGFVPETPLEYLTLESKLYEEANG